MKRYELLVFDWDGTLCDSSAQITNSMQSAIADLGLPLRTDEQISQSVGLDLFHVVEILYPELDLGTHAKLKQTFNYYYFAKSSPACLFKNGRQVLQKLVDNGYTLAIATGMSRAGLDAAIEQTGIGDLISATRCAEETASKPHPQMLEELMAELNVEPEKTLMIGDSECDMELGENANVCAIAVTQGTQDQSRLIAHHPITCQPDLESVCEWILAEDV